MRSKKRGSALVLTVMLTLATTTAIMAMAGLIHSTATIQSKWERDAKLQYSFEGVVAKVEADVGSGSLVAPSALTVTLNGIQWNVSVTDNGPAIRKSFKIDASAQFRGATFSKAAVTADPKPVSPANFALASGQALNLLNLLTVGVSGSGDLYVEGTLATSIAGSTVAGGIYITVPTAPIGSWGANDTNTNAKKVIRTTVVPSDYTSTGALTVASNSLSNINFVTPYQLMTRTGNLSVSGTITGKGTIFVDGNLTINGNLSYGTADSIVAFVVTGNVSSGLTVSQGIGIYHIEGSLQTNNLLGMTYSKSSIYAKGGLGLGGALSVRFDPRVKQDQLEGERLKLPGYWP
jgi:hypothetical protein